MAAATRTSTSDRRFRLHRLRRRHRRCNDPSKYASPNRVDLKKTFRKWSKGIFLRLQTYLIELKKWLSENLDRCACADSSQAKPYLCFWKEPTQVVESILSFVSIR